MKIMAINGSPRGKTSSTYHLLKPLLKGMEYAGADIQLIHLSSVQVSKCTGCFACWTTSPGKCIIKDDMDLILEEYIQTDLVIYATPLHTYHMSGLLKNFIDRCFPLHTSTMVNTSNNISSLLNRYTKPNKMLLVSNCGFPELEHFEHLTSYFKHLAKSLNQEYIGHILQPMGETLKRPTSQKYLEPFYKALKKAGKMIIEQGYLPNIHLENIHNKWPIDDPEEYQVLANRYYKDKQKAIAKQKIKKQQKNIPDTENLPK